MFMIIADGIPWADADGNTEFTDSGVDAQCEVIASQGYAFIQVIEVAPAVSTGE
jgi:hypothetical protein